MSFRIRKLFAIALVLVFSHGAASIAGAAENQVRKTTAKFITVSAGGGTNALDPPPKASLPPLAAFGARRPGARPFRAGGKAQSKLR